MYEKAVQELILRIVREAMQEKGSTVTIDFTENGPYVTVEPLSENGPVVLREVLREVLRDD